MGALIEFFGQLVVLLFCIAVCILIVVVLTVCVLVIINWYKEIKEEVFSEN